MSEMTIVFTSFGALIGLAIGSLLYSLGGRFGKWQRRFVGSSVIATTVNVCALIMGSWNWWLLGIFPILIGGFCCGYGANDLFKKIFRRSIFAAAIVGAGLLCAIVLGGNAWRIFPLHVILGAFTVYIGVRNPFYAAAEETFICMLLNLILITYPFVVM